MDEMISVPPVEPLVVSEDGVKRMSEVIDEDKELSNVKE